MGCQVHLPRHSPSEAQGKIKTEAMHVVRESEMEFLNISRVIFSFICQSIFFFCLVGLFHLTVDVLFCRPVTWPYAEAEAARPSFVARYFSHVHRRDEMRSIGG